MNTVLENPLFTSIILPIIIAFVTADITVTFERTKMVYELQRTTYLKLLKLLMKIEENSDIIYDKSFFRSMKECALEMEVYASKRISRRFFELWREIYEEHKEYYNEFENPILTRAASELSCSERKKFDSIRKQASECRRQNNPVNPQKIFELSCQLKDAILVSLRRG